MTATLIDEKNNQYKFNVNGHNVTVYADCYEKACIKLQEIFAEKISFE